MMHAPTFRIPVLLLSLLVLTLAACAGPRETADPREDVEELPTPAVRLADYEDFDPSPYREEEPRPEEELAHDVPDPLMEGRADEGVLARVQGFRVQVYSTIDKNAAVDHEEMVRNWWRENEDDVPQGVAGDLPVSIVYMQPYYRVRVGAFRTREAAEEARRFLARRFPEAFIVPDTITITR